MRLSAFFAKWANIEFFVDVLKRLTVEAFKQGHCETASNLQPLNGLTMRVGCIIVREK
jgi:hypothetical protein